MGKDLRGKELGVGLSQKSTGQIVARVMVEGKVKSKHFTPKDPNHITKSELNEYLFSVQCLKRNIDSAETSIIVSDKQSTDNDITLDEYFKVWYHSNTGIKKETEQVNARCYENRISPYLGNMNLSAIKTANIKVMFRDLQSKSYSKHYITRIKTVLNQIFDAAVDDELIEKNPLTKKIKVVGNEPRENLILNEGQEAEFLSLLENTIFYHPLKFCLLTGFRYGELAGLKWSDVDFKSRTMSIRRTLGYDRKNATFYEKTPKTKASIRTLKLCNEAFDILEAVKVHNAILPKVEPYTEYVFLNSIGLPFKKEAYNRRLTNIKKQMSLTDYEKSLKFSIHTLRHIYATRCREKGVYPEALMKLMGHTKVTTTLKYYVHTTDTMMDDAYQKLGI